MPDKRYILLTFDVEEFDLPLEYNIPITADEQMLMGKAGLDAINGILSTDNLKTTLFTTANFAKEFPDEIKEHSSKHEIASHSFYHSGFKKEDLLNSRIELERITGKTVTGFRMPRMKPINLSWIKDAGYEYDSSINPTYIPGRYNNWKCPRTLHKENGLLRMPTSVSPNLRIPLFWLSFKNLPYPIFYNLALQTLKTDGYLSLYFHPWEFIDLGKYPLAFYLKRLSGPLLLNKLNRLIVDLQKHAEFIPVNDFIIQEGQER